MLSDKLLTLRRRRGMSQQDVADAIGVTRQTVSNWELGQGAPALDKAAELARLYRVTIDDLVRDEVDVVASNRKRPTKDLHVLEFLVGKTVTVELEDGEGAITNARMLDASGEWVRLECDAPKALFGGKGDAKAIVKLVSISDIAGFSIEGGTL